MDLPKEAEGEERPPQPPDPSGEGGRAPGGVHREKQKRNQREEGEEIPVEGRQGGGVERSTEKDQQEPQQAAFPRDPRRLVGRIAGAGGR